MDTLTHLKLIVILGLFLAIFFAVVAFFSTEKDPKEISGISRTKGAFFMFSFIIFGVGIIVMYGILRD